MNAATDKMKSYATAIAESLMLPTPNFDSFDDTFDFIAKHKERHENDTIKANAVAIEMRLNVVCRMLADSFIDEVRQNVNGRGVYLIWSGETLLYVGKSKSLKYRLLESILERFEPEHPPTHFSIANTETDADMHILEPVIVAEHKPLLNSEFVCADKPVMFKCPIDIYGLERKEISIAE